MMGGHGTKEASEARGGGGEGGEEEEGDKAFHCARRESRQSGPILTCGEGRRDGRRGLKLELMSANDA